MNQLSTMDSSNANGFSADQALALNELSNTFDQKNDALDATLEKWEQLNVDLLEYTEE